MKLTKGKIKFFNEIRAEAEAFSERSYVPILTRQKRRMWDSITKWLSLSFAVLYFELNFVKYLE